MIYWLWREKYENKLTALKSKYETNYNVPYIIQAIANVMELEALSVGFEVMEDDHCVYVNRNKDCFVIISLYVDDILLVEKFEMLNETKSRLSSIVLHFEMKDMDGACYVLVVNLKETFSPKRIVLKNSWAFPWND